VTKTDRVVTEVLGWELLEIDYIFSNDPTDLLYQDENAGSKLKRGTLVVHKDDDGDPIVITPSHAKWWDLIRREQVDNVGLYYVLTDRINIDDKLCIIERDDFKPFQNAHDDYQVLKRVKSKWPQKKRDEYSGVLWSIQRIMAGYKVGDWSRAALEVVDR